jgi:hypothetical protein
MFVGHLPTLDIFKMAMLNKTFQNLILTIFKPLKMIHFKKFFETMKCIECFSTTPTLDKYQDLSRLEPHANAANLKIVQGFQAGYEQDIFGGSILKPLDDKQNLMYEAIMKIRGTHGGFYQLYNVKNGEELYDIEILIDWSWISSQTGFKKLEQWHETFKKLDDIKNLPLEGNCIEFSEIKNYLTGYARVVEVYNDTNYNIF